jgi:hypothetical protein
MRRLALLPESSPRGRPAIALSGCVSPRFWCSRTSSTLRSGSRETSPEDELAGRAFRQFLTVVLRGVVPLLLLAVGCLRFSEPELFACEVDEDCRAGEKCVRASSGDYFCRPQDFCWGDYDCLGLGFCNVAKHQCQTTCSEQSPCPAGSSCRDGTCVEVECTETYAEVQCHGLACVDGNCLKICGNDANCVEGYHCVSGDCLTAEQWNELKICDADQPLCMGWQIGLCNSVGTEVTDVASCKDGQACYAGACRSIECPPGEDFCHGTEYRTCASDAGSSTLISSCTDGTLCQGLGACAELECRPGESVCPDRWVSATCADDGAGFEDDYVACAEDQSCVPGVGCTATQEVAIGDGSDPKAVSGAMFGNQYRIDHEVVLASIQADASIGDDAHFVIYTSWLEYGTYDLVADYPAGWVAGYSQPTSGPIEQSLSSGSYVLIALYSAGGMLTYATPDAIGSISGFGLVIGSFVANVTSLPESLESGDENPGVTTALRQTLTLVEATD